MLPFIRIIVRFFLIALLPQTNFAQNRNSSAPYLSGDTFRAYADFVIDETGIEFFPEQVTPYSVIFLKTDYMDLFFSQYHDEISVPYILITHNSDCGAPGQWVHRLDEENLIAWFAQNVEILHPKLHPIPIGLANQYWSHGDTLVFDVVRSINKENRDKPTHLLYMNISVSTFPSERSIVFNQFVNQPFCFSQSRKGLHSYLIDLASSKFVLSPRGNGLDCHRTWEALYMGSIPIVKNSSLDSMYDALPVVIVRDWSEVTESFLNQKYLEVSPESFCLEKLYAPYWFNLIDSFREMPSNIGAY